MTMEQPPPESREAPPPRSVETPPRRSLWKAWSPAQLIAAAVGVFYIVVGAVAMARTGFEGGLTEPEAEVVGFNHTPLLAIIVLVFGVLMLTTAAGPWEAMGSLTGLGVFALVFGIIFLIEADAFHDALAVETAHGWLYLVTGAVSIFAGAVAPIIWRRVG